MLQALKVCHIITFLILFSLSIRAGTTGKLVGTITDQETGNPLPGVNIIIIDTYWGASTDLDGNFLILNLPPGIYDLEISMLGYQTILKKNVKVSVDLTTNLSIQLAETAILGDEVVVVAERPLIQSDITSKQAYIDGKDLTEEPWHERKRALHELNFSGNVLEVRSLIANKPNVQTGSLFVFMIEKMPITCWVDMIQKPNIMI